MVVGISSLVGGWDSTRSNRLHKYFNSLIVAGGTLIPSQIPLHITSISQHKPVSAVLIRQRRVDNHQNLNYFGAPSASRHHDS